MKHIVWALGGALGLAMAVQAAPPPPAETFFAPADIDEAVLSPSGERLALGMSVAGSRRGLFVVDLRGAPKVQRAALFREVDVHGVAWLNDERLVYATRDDADGGGWYPGKPGPGLFSVNADGSLPRELIERGGDSGREGREASRLQQLVLGPNHRLAAVPRGADGQEVLVIERRAVSDRGAPVEMPRWLDTRNGRTRRVDHEVSADATSWLFDAQGDARVMVTRDGEKLTVHWRAPGAKAWRAITEGTLLGLPFVAQAVDEQGRLYVSQRVGAAGHRVLKRFDFDKGQPEAEPLVSTPGFDFEGHLVQDAADGRVLGVRLTTDAQTTVWFGAAMQRFQREVDERFPGRVNRIDCRRCGEAGMVALVRSYSDRDPGRLHVFRAGDAGAAADAGRWQTIGALRAAVQPAQMGQVEFQRIRARDGRDLPVWLTRPPGVTGAAPAVVLVHGGPWLRGKRWEWNAMAQFLATRGYLVIEPEFRGSQGYGWAHYQAGWKQWGQAMQDDVADALLWARQQGLAGERACIAGASYGGYSTLMGLVRHPELYRCGAAWVAVSDLPLLVQGDWRVQDDLGDSSRQFTLPQTVGHPEQDAEMLRANSPVHLADRIRAPLLLAFGESDQRVPLAHGSRLRSALQKAGHEPEYQVYVGEGHGFRALSTQLDFAARLERFLARHLQGD